MLKADYIKDDTIKMAWGLSDPDRIPDLLVAGNKKTGKHGKFGYMYRTKGLAIHDCPQSTAACRSACYAIMDHLFNLERGHGVAHHYSKLAHTDPMALYDKLDSEIQGLLKKKRIKRDGLVIRVHESADFVSRMHVKAYTFLASKYPSVIFFGYSRSWVDPKIGEALAELNQLPNVHIRESLDNDRHIGTGMTSLAFFGDKDKEPSRSFKCIEQLNDTKCIDCGLCWNQRSLNVIFKQH